MHGNMAATAESKYLDNAVNVASHAAFELMSRKYDGLTFKAKFDKSEIPGNRGACKPDGGIWYFNGIPVMAIEAKHQNNAGNAIERWYKNQFIARAINPKMSYLTICTGDGADDNGVIYNTLHAAHLKGYNKIVAHGNSAYMCPEGITVDALIVIICKLFEATIKRKG